MQDRYAGDIGDFVKYGLLRAIAGDSKTGVVWYLHANEARAGDGRHIDYLKRPDTWRHVDCELYHALQEIVESGHRSVAAVQQATILPDATFADEPLDVSDVRVRDREDLRRSWFERVLDRLTGCELVFADPDNGLLTDRNFKPTRAKSTKSLPVREALALSEGRPAMIYHHNTRRKGGHRKEIAYWQRQLPGHVYAYYWRRWGNRTFFLLNLDLDEQMLERLHYFACRWSEVNPDGLIAPP